MKSIQIGTSDFKELIERNNYFIDKSLLIKEFIENGGVYSNNYIFNCA